MTGCGDNVNYAFQSLAGLLVHFNIFRHVYIDRLDVGYVITITSVLCTS